MEIHIQKASSVFHKEYEQTTNTIKSCTNNKAVKTVNKCIAFNFFISVNFNLELLFCPLEFFLH